MLGNIRTKIQKTLWERNLNKKINEKHFKT